MWKCQVRRVEKCSSDAEKNWGVRMPCWVLDPNSEHRMGVQNCNPTKAMAVAVAANAAWDCGWSDCQYRNWLIVAQSLSVTCVDCTHCVLLISLCVHVHMFCPIPSSPPSPTNSSTCSCWCGLHAHIKYTQCTHGDGQSKRLHSVSTWHAVLKP